MNTESEATSGIFDAIRLKDKTKLDSILRDNLDLLLPERWTGRCSPLHFAAFMNWQYAALKFVVHFPALARVEDEVGQSALEIAEARGFHELAESLRPFAFPKHHDRPTLDNE